MFGLRKKPPIAPINETGVAWVESSFERLAAFFGKETLHNRPVVLPTSEFFPDTWENADECVELTLRRICSLMNIERNSVQLEIEYDDFDERREALPYLRESQKGAGGLYVPSDDKPIIVIKLDRSRQIDSIIATLAHELSHVLLLGSGKVSRDEADMELLTDLCTIFWGFGVFKANTAVRFSQYHTSRGYGWRSSRQGYMPEEMIGYALAVFADLRCEVKPVWARQLNIYVNAFYKQSVRYLNWKKKKTP